MATKAQSIPEGIMRRKLLRLGAPSAVGLALAGPATTAPGQLTVVDSSRTVTASSCGTSPNNNLGAGANDSHSQTSSATGLFNQSAIATVNYNDPTQLNPSGGTPTYVGNDTALQNSLVSDTLFSGSGSSGGNCQVEIPAEPTDGEYTTGDSRFLADFTVDAPTVMTISGTLYADYFYGLGKLPTPSATFTLSGSGSGTPIYTVQTPLPFSFFEPTTTVPFSFQTTLQPGQTFTLLADAGTTSSFYSDSDGTEQNDASFVFTAAVPEPITLSLLPLAGLPAVRRRTRRVRGG
jgi:hypothetical protein